MPSRASNQFNNGVNGTNLATVSQRVRQETGLIKAMKGDYKRVTISSYNYQWYKLPDQKDISTLSKELEGEGYQYVLYSQTHQNESDKLSYDMSVDYAEDRYVVTQKTEEGNMSYIFNGTYGIGKDRATTAWWLSLENYMKKYPDAVFLGIGKFKETARIE